MITIPLFATTNDELYKHSNVADWALQGLLHCGHNAAAQTDVLSAQGAMKHMHT